MKNHEDLSTGMLIVIWLAVLLAFFSFMGVLYLLSQGYR